MAIALFGAVGLGLRSASDCGVPITDTIATQAERVATAHAATPRVERQSTSACCDDGDCPPGECPAPCRGRCVCLTLHGLPLSMTTTPSLSGVVVFGATPPSRTELAPLVVSREPALRPPIA